LTLDFGDMSSFEKVVRAVLFASFVLGCSTQSAGQEVGAEELRKVACEGALPHRSPWHIANLHDCATNSLYIPYQLWTGEAWDGRRDVGCMHPAAKEFLVNRRSRTRIDGPIKWNGQDVWARVKTNGAKSQYFVCHAKGIGRVYDSRRPDWRPAPGRCKFPAGLGWKIGVARDCDHTRTKILDVELDDAGRLFALRFEWFYESRGTFVHDHDYRYQVGKGMTHAEKQ
jgi:hypothetical protein